MKPTNALLRALAWARARPGMLAIVMLGIAWGTVMHQMGWAQLAHFAEVQALADGRKDVDPWHWESGDVAYIDGHYYSVKSPGVAALSVPLYLGLEAVGGLDVAADAARNTSRSDQPRWISDQGPPYAQYGFDAARALRVEERIEDATPVVWFLTLVAAVIPAVLLLFGVRRLADRLEPGYGTAAAVTLGTGTILMIFAAEFFSHAISAALGFAAFAVLIQERAGPQRPLLVAAAGLLAGLALTFEVQVGLVGVVLLGLAIARSGALRRAAAYGAGAVAGAIPTLAFNWWMLGSPLRLAYGDAVAEIGRSGHQEIGLNDDGFFGITLPRFDAAVDLLLGGRGALVLTPVLVMAVVGVVLMYRRGHRAPAVTIAAVALAYFLYNCGYWQPFGGGTPGPRFLVPCLPFLALGLAFAYRRFPATTLALAVPSALWMLAASLTYPLIGEQGTALWVEYIGDGRLEHTLLSVLGVGSNWIAIVPVVLALAVAAWLGARATPHSGAVARIDAKLAIGALLGWVAVSALGPTIAEEPVTPLDGGPEALLVVACGALASLAALAVYRYRARAERRSGREPITAELALGDLSS
ncbi:MAG: hypothetical protein ACRDK9_13205 [Solirubrobacterales bacterium]